MSRFKPYPEYKDSGVESLQSVPMHWEVIPMKHLVSFNDEVLPETTDADFEFQYVDIGSVSSVDGIVDRQPTVFSAAPSRARRLVRKGDTIISTVRTYLRAIASITEEDNGVVVSTGFAVLRPRKLYSGYLGYLCKEDHVVEQIVARSTGVSYPAINSSEIGEVPALQPPVSEQRQIARFLDHEIARIDALMSEQERLIDLLKEKRQAVISHAVTKGLNSDAPMKESGVEWLGKVPAHWDVLSFYIAVEIAEGQVDPRVAPYKQMVLIAPNHIEANTGRLIETQTAEAQGADSGKYLCEPGDVIYSKIRPALRKACIAPIACLCSADMYPMRGRKGAELNTRYLYWLILSEYFSAFTKLESDRVAMPKINRDSLNLLKILRPPISEQNEIDAYLSQITNEIDSSLALANEAAEILQERRSALISAAVTGKIDVRDWQPPTDVDTLNTKETLTSTELA